MRTPARPRFPPPIIRFAEREDIPELVRVWLAAERTNLLMFYHFPTEESRSEYAKEVIKQFEEDFDKPHLLVLKAVDPETKQITAMGVWQKRGYDFSPQSDNIFAAAGIMLNGTLKTTFKLNSSNFWLHGVRRGIGTAMLEWGHKYADGAGIPAFLIASPVGHPLYQHVGWKDVDTPLQIDMSQWVAAAQGGDMGWGVYKYYYMLRMPKTAAS